MSGAMESQGRATEQSTIASADAQFRFIADCIPALAWYAAPDGHIPWYNRRWLEYTGKTLEEQMGWGWESVHDPADLPRVVAKWRASLASGEPWEDEFRLRRHDGHFRWFLSRATPLRDESGRIVLWFGMNVDVDDQKHASEELRRHATAELHASEERFHQLVDAVTDYAIFMLDATGHVATWNAGARRIKGYEAAEIVGRHFSVFYTPEDRASGKPERILDTLRREGRYEDESWRVRKDGTRFWANVVITALRDEKGRVTGFAKVTRDLTARRAAEENERELVREQLARVASEAARQEMERVSRAKDEFLATMSHELRTPLNAITGWASLLLRTPRDPQKLDKGLEVIHRNAKAQARIIGDLLDVSRIISGKLQLAAARTELLPIIVAAADVVRPAAENKGIRLVLDVDPEVGATVADPERVQQILWNLLTNAVKFTSRGGRITLTGDRRNSSIVIRVQDTGAGIAPEHLPHIFERFVQVDSSTTRQHGGLGLGLAIVRHLVEAHGGTVQAESQGLGQGAAFTVTLPIRAVSVAPKEEHAAPDTAESETEDHESTGRFMRLDGVRVLVVDDDPDGLDVVREVLERAGATVTTARSAREGVTVIDSRGPFDVIVSDIGMPETDGYTFLRAVRTGERAHDVPAIALTAYARPTDADLALLAGYQEHLAKPVDEARLLKAVRNWSRRPASPTA
ncbi:MAG TPA: PAS domain S-box protein [Polyangiaceae bacterium]